MPCPTCDHTLSKLAAENGRSWYHCDRCGTVVAVQHNTDRREAHVPALVGRCRKLLTEVVRDLEYHPGAKSLLSILGHLGITEAIHVPENRPKV